MISPQALHAAKQLQGVPPDQMLGKMQDVLPGSGASLAELMTAYKLLQHQNAQQAPQQALQMAQQGGQPPDQGQQPPPPPQGQDQSQGQQQQQQQQPPPPPPPQPTTVADDVYKQLGQHVAQAAMHKVRQGGIADLPVKEGMFEDDTVHAASGGIIAFNGGGTPPDFVTDAAGNTRPLPDPRSMPTVVPPENVPTDFVTDAAGNTREVPKPRNMPVPRAPDAPNIGRIPIDNPPVTSSGVISQLPEAARSIPFGVTRTGAVMDAFNAIGKGVSRAASSPVGGIAQGMLYSPDAVAAEIPGYDTDAKMQARRGEVALSLPEIDRKIDLLDQQQNELRKEYNSGGTKAKLQNPEHYSNLKAKLDAVTNQRRALMTEYQYAAGAGGANQASFGRPQRTDAQNLLERGTPTTPQNVPGMMGDNDFATRKSQQPPRANQGLGATPEARAAADKKAAGNAPPQAPVGQAPVGQAPAGQSPDQGFVNPYAAQMTAALAGSTLGERPEKLGLTDYLKQSGDVRRAALKEEMESPEYKAKLAALTAQADEAKKNRDVDRMMALAQGFFAMGAGTSPRALENFAKGMGIGAEHLTAAEKDYRKAEQLRKDKIDLVEEAARKRAEGNATLAQAMSDRAEDKGLKYDETMANINSRLASAVIGAESHARTEYGAEKRNAAQIAANKDIHKLDRESRERVAALEREIHKANLNKPGELERIHNLISAAPENERPVLIKSLTEAANILSLRTGVDKKLESADRKAAEAAYQKEASLLILQEQQERDPTKKAELQQQLKKIRDRHFEGIGSNESNARPIMRFDASGNQIK